MEHVKSLQKQINSRNYSACIPVLIIMAACALLAMEAELRLAIPMLVGVTATVTVTLAVVLYYGERDLLDWSPSVILTVALLLRLLFLFSPPQLSDDIYRYLWDGSNLLHGINPYAAAPSTVTPSSELAAIHSRINHPQYVTIYPPAAQLLFSLGAALGGSVTGLKILLALLDLGVCGLVIVLLKRLELPAWRAVLYAWNPLPVLEIAGSGHVDGAGLTMLMGAFCLLLVERKSAAANIPRRWPFLLSGVLLAFAGLVKLFPFVLAPVLLLLVPPERRMHFWAGFLGALAALLLLFMPHLINVTASLDLYARNWEFAGFAFSMLRTMTGSGMLARLLLFSSFVLIAVAIFFRLTGGIKRINRATAPAVKGRLALEACYAIAMALLLLTPTLQPWYALCLAVFLPFCAGPAGLLLCWAVFLTYQVQIPYFILGQWIENQSVTTAVFLAPVTAYVMGRLFSERRQSAR